MANSGVTRCEIAPLPHQQVAFSIDGREVTRWHFAADAPRPFFYPLIGPTGAPLTRMGHPGAPNHDHHRSVWFAHHKIQGIDFWSDQTTARIEQTHWLAYEDGDDECRFAFDLLWKDGHDPQPLLQQRLLGAVIPDTNDGWSLELQSTWTPTSNMLELGKTNFGFLAVRVARSISAVFGNGDLRDSKGRQGEPAIFGQRAKWMDYSGPVRGGDCGIAFLDHPQNPNHPTRWHVRADGWMGASVCFDQSRLITREQPLTLRYQLWIHADRCPSPAIEKHWSSFAQRAPLALVPRPAPHREYGIRRAPHD